MKSIYRCSVCLRETIKVDNVSEIFDAAIRDTTEWFKAERKTQILTIQRRIKLADYSSLCPECGHYIRKNMSWIIELLQEHPDPQVFHDNGEFHDTSGLWVHFDCYKEMIRRLPCNYCGETPAGTIDHKKPRDHGGEDQPYNIIAACVSCNSSKGTRNRSNYKSYRENIKTSIEA